jgi:LAS superfamily LD-carboxypeptidase LdcB
MVYSGEVEAYQPFDFFSDDSYQKFLDDANAFSASYLPADLVAVHSDFTANRSADFQLREEVATQFADMAWAFAHTFNFKSKLSITSAYRSPTYQKKLASNCSLERCALP